MLNNKGKGLYEIGEHINLPCGCEMVAEEIGYTHYVNPKCKFDNRFHALIPNYHYEQMLKEVSNGHIS